MQVFASYVSAISSAEVRFELKPYGVGVAFCNVKTGTFEHGTFTDAANKFAALELFRGIFRELSPSFELR